MLDVKGEKRGGCSILLERRDCSVSELEEIKEGEEEASKTEATEKSVLCSAASSERKLLSMSVAACAKSVAGCVSVCVSVSRRNECRKSSAEESWNCCTAKDGKKEFECAC